LHPRNKHNNKYDLEQLSEKSNTLKSHLISKSNNELSVNFKNPKAVLALNTAILKTYYGLHYWEIPENHLCPPIPSRADYIHYIADLLTISNGSEIPKGKNTTILDLGVGANCIYPILGNHEYGWQFIGSDISTVSIASAEKIITNNTHLRSAINLRLQKDKNHFFKGILTNHEKIQATICNPPFHASAEEAEAATYRKNKNLHGQNDGKQLNFGGQHNELWCKGGELLFLKKMIEESLHFKNQVLWFTSLISKKENIRPLKVALKKVNAEHFQVIPMEQGNKISRILCWTFCSKPQHKKWFTQTND